MSDDEARQAKVIALVNAMNTLLADTDLDERCTAISLVAACQIIATTASDAERRGMAKAFAHQTCDFFGPEFVSWVRSGMTWSGETSRTKQ